MSAKSSKVSWAIFSLFCTCFQEMGLFLPECVSFLRSKDKVYFTKM